MAKKQKRERQQFSFEARMVSNVIVTVEAYDEKEARELAESGDWIDEQRDGMADWEIRGRTK